MKNLVLIIFLGLFISCKSQTVVAYDSDLDVFIDDSNKYYKDVNNNFNVYEGIWIYEENGISITLHFDKEIAINDNSGYIYDLLVGEYQYKLNGNIVVNTLSLMEDPTVIGFNHNIAGFQILSKYNSPQCTDCSENERRIELGIHHQTLEDVEDTIVLRHFVENGIEKLRVIIYDSGSNSVASIGDTNDIEVPFGEYTFIKQ